MTVSKRKIFLGLAVIAIIAVGWYGFSKWQDANENQLAEGWLNAMVCNRPTLATVEAHFVSRGHSSAALTMLTDKEWIGLDWIKARELSPKVDVSTRNVQPYLVRCIQAANGTGQVECGVSVSNELWVMHEAYNVYHNVRMPVVVLLPKQPSKVLVAVSRSYPPEAYYK